MLNGYGVQGGNMFNVDVYSKKYTVNLYQILLVLIKRFKYIRETDVGKYLYGK